MKITSIINNSTDKKLTQGESYLLEKIKNLYAREQDSDSRKIHIYINPIINTLRPDFIIIDSDMGVSIVEVKDWDRSFIKEVTKIHVFTQANQKLDNPALKAKRYKEAAIALLSNSLDLINDDGDLNFDITTSLAFPNMIESDFEDVKSFFPESHANTLTKNLLRQAKLDDFFKEKTKLSDDAIKSIRWLIFPENRIKKDRNSGVIEAATIHGVDITQEKIAKYIP